MRVNDIETVNLQDFHIILNHIKKIGYHPTVDHYNKGLTILDSKTRLTVVVITNILWCCL